MVRGFWILTICLLAVLALPCAGRPVRGWTHADLTKQADVIVIGMAASNRDVSGFASAPTKGAAVPVDTVFNVQTVLKGPFGLASVSVRHDRYARSQDAVTIVDGPGLVSFDPQKRIPYLIYLKKDGENYTPLTGQFDPWFSFYRLTPYSDNAER
jgi:hypothetical protein